MGDKDRYDDEVHKKRILNRLLTNKSCCSEPATTLVSKMLLFSPADRPSAQAVLQDPWFAQGKHEDVAELIHERDIEALANFHRRDKVQRSVLQHVASQMGAKDM